MKLYETQLTDTNFKLDPIDSRRRYTIILVKLGKRMNRNLFFIVSIPCLLTKFNFSSEFWVPCQNVTKKNFTCQIKNKHVDRFN